MGKEFRSIAEINRYLMPILIEEMKKLGEEVRKALQSELKAKFYGRPGYHPNQQETDWYSRTWELLECISLDVKSSGNEVTARIFYDTDKMNTSPSYIKNGVPQWSSHESIIDGRDFREALPEVIEYGNPSRIYGWEAFNIVGDLTERFSDDQIVLQWFKHALEKRGINCE